MIKVKLFRWMVFSVILSVACAISTGCSYVEKSEQTERNMNDQAEENVINGTNFSVEKSKDLETDVSAVAETSTTTSSTQELPTFNMETDIAIVPSIANTVDSSDSQDMNNRITSNNDIVEPSDSPVPLYDSIERQEEVIPYGEYKTITGYDLTHTEPTKVTVGIKSVKRGIDAYEALLENNTMLSTPKEGTEYTIITVNYSYNEGPLEELNLEETHGTDPLGKHFFFLAYATDMTEYVQDCIYDKTIKKGEMVDGNIAFLTPINNTWPLAFFGYGEKIGFAINP